LDTLTLKGNVIEDFEEEIIPILSTMNRLKKIDLSLNPITAIPKYRDHVVILTSSL